MGSILLGHEGAPIPAIMGRLVDFPQAQRPGLAKNVDGASRAIPWRVSHTTGTACHRCQVES